MSDTTGEVPERGRTSLFTAREPAYPLGPRFAGPRQGLAGGCAPSDPPKRHIMDAGRGRDWSRGAGLPGDGGGTLAVHRERLILLPLSNSTAMGSGHARLRRITTRR